MHNSVSHGMRLIATLLAAMMIGLTAITIRLTEPGYANVKPTSSPPRSARDGDTPSTAERTECGVTLDGPPDISGNVFRLWLNNATGSQVPLETIWFAFPAENRALHGVWLNDEQLWAGWHSTSPATFTAGVSLAPAAVPTGTAHLDFVFPQPVASSPYAVELGFPGQCRIVYPAPCQVEIAGDEPPSRDGNMIWLVIRNSGAVPAEPRSLAAEWDAATNGALRKVMFDGAVVWEGEDLDGSAAVELDDGAAPTIEPEATARLGLTFEQTPPDAPYGLLGVMVEFLEGCSLQYPPQPTLPVEFEGVIAGLPENVHDGIWQIQPTGGTEPVEVLVTERTIVEPQDVQPRRGDSVSVTALLSDQRFVATRIRIIPTVSERVEFRGIIEAVDLTSVPPEMTVQGITVILTDATVTNQPPSEEWVGWIARVVGLRQPDGSVIAEEVTVTNPGEAQQVEFSGVVEGWEPLSELRSLWLINGINVIVDAEETVHHGIDPGQEPELGAETLVRGLYQPDGTVFAVELWYGSPEKEILEFEGIIIHLPENPNLLGTWEILDLETNEERKVLVTEETFIVITDTLPATGVPVQVRARVNPDGSLEALRIEILPVTQ